jgi:hypothetical protein
MKNCIVWVHNLWLFIMLVYTVIANVKVLFWKATRLKTKILTKKKKKKLDKYPCILLQMYRGCFNNVTINIWNIFLV